MQSREKFEFLEDFVNSQRFLQGILIFKSDGWYSLDDDLAISS